MAISCVPDTLMEAARCFACLSPAQANWVQTYLLAQIASDTHTPEELLALAKCFSCLSAKQLQEIIAYLLCQIGNGGSPAPAECENLSGAVDPTGVSTPDFIGQTYRDTATGNIYTSTGLTNADWSLTVQDMGVRWTQASLKLGEYITLSIPGEFVGLSSISYTETTSEGGFFVNINSSIVSFSAPNLTGIDVANNYGGSLNFTSNPGIESISVPLLSAIGGSVQITDNANLTSIIATSLITVGSNLDLTYNPSLTAINLPALVTVSGSFWGDHCDLLATVNLSSFLPTNTKGIEFHNCALTLASVDHILDRCVANAGYISGTIKLNGGTNAAPTQGEGSAHDILVARGVTITHN